jgi:hypothetical protein
MLHIWLAFFISVLTINNYAATLNFNAHASPLASALVIGTEANGRTLFLCRVNLSDIVQFGKTWAGSQQCILTDNGKQYAVSQFIIPNEKEFGHYMWAAKGGKGIPMGTDSKGDSLFLCQSYFNGSIFPGKTWSGYDHCNIAYNGVEVIADITYILSSM